MMDQNSVQENVSYHPLTSILLLLIGYINFIIADILNSFTFEGLYIWTFRIFSLLSVVLIVIVNWRKAFEELKKIFHIK